MAGIFSKANRPKLAGAFTNWENQPQSPVPSQPGGAVAIPFTHDWGPLAQVVRVQSFGEFQAIFGSSDDTDGYRAVKQAFLGEDTDGRRGAGEVVAYRMGGSAALGASKGLSNGTTTAITLTAKYPGTRGNDLRVTTQDGTAGGQDDLLILDGTVLLEKYTYTETDITALAALINANSDWVTAGSVTSGTALAHVASSAFTGGNDGTTLTSTEWLALMADLEVEPFAALVAYKLTDGAIQASLKAWAVGTPSAKGQNLLGKRFFVLTGGAAAETLSTAQTRSAALADPNIINAGRGTITDDTLGPGGTAIDLSTSETIARVGGALVARGEFQSLSGARFSGWTVKDGATLAEQEAAFDSGVLVYGRDSHPTSPVKVAVGLSTWTQTAANADPSKPYLIYRQPKYVRTMHGIEQDCTSYAEQNVEGLRPINDDTRNAVLGFVKQNLAGREDLGVILPGWTSGIDQSPAPTDEDEFIAIATYLKFGRALEQVYFTFAVA